MANNLWVTTLAGLEVARSETWGTSAERAADYRAASPEPMANCPQTVLEPMLLVAAREMGADIRFGWEFASLAQDQDGLSRGRRASDPRRHGGGSPSRRRVGLGSGCDHEFAWWPGLEALPGLADVIQPCVLQVQGELPVDGVTHQLRVGGTAHLGGRGGLAVTHER